MEYSTQNLEYAVSVFYNGEQDERSKAHAWLTDAQSSPDAWQFVWELLKPDKKTEIQFYAATTLHMKILRSWNDVPIESYEELKNKLLEVLLTYSKGPKIVTNRLCISLAAFILQQGAADLPSILRPLSTSEHSALLLEVLTVIPEEYNSMTMGSSLRNQNRAALQKTCRAVLDDMSRYFYNLYSISFSIERPPSEEVIQWWHSAAICACSWMSLGGEGSHDTGSLPLTDCMPLCRSMYLAVLVIYQSTEVVSDSALDACETCLAAIRVAGTTYHAHRHQKAAIELITDVSTIADHMLRKDNVPNSINEEILSAIITCLVALGDNHTKAIVSSVERGQPDEAHVMQFIEVLLAAQASPGHYPLQETRSNLVFGFWYSLQDEITNVRARSEKVNPIWQKVFSRLLTTLIIKSETPADLSLTRDDKELLRCYRQDIADAVMYCYAVVGAQCYALVEKVFVEAETAARREAALHALLALADAVPAGPLPPALLAMLQRAVRLVHTESAPHVVATALDCIGGYSVWLSNVEAPRGGELCRECIVAAGAALPRCTRAAARALRRICINCRAAATPLALDICLAAQSGPARADPWVQRQLLTAAGAALDAASDATADPLLAHLIQDLMQDLTKQGAESLTGGGDGACNAAECVVALLAALGGGEGAGAARAAKVFHALMPALPPLAHHQAHPESLFSILKQVVLLKESLPMIADIAQLCVTSFNTKPSATGLDFVRLLILAVGTSWAGTGGVVRSCTEAAARAVAPDPSASADLTEALFSLLHVLTKKKPQYLEALDDVLSDLVDLACKCVRLWEMRAARAACAWLAVLAELRPLTLQPHAPSLTVTAIECIGGASPRQQIDPVAELLLSLNRASFSDGDLAAWLRQALHPPGFPTVHATPTHKHKFITAVIKEKSSKRRLLETVQEFSLACRGLIGTEYARQTIASKQMVA